VTRNLKLSQIILLGGLLFGLFFGSGNLIFPIYMGQNAGYNSLIVLIGFIVTAVGLPMLGIIALGVSGLTGAYEAASKFNKKFGLFIATSLYLIIGPFLIAPRNGAVSYDIIFSPFIGEFSIVQLIFYSIFFLLVLLLAIKPGKVLFWIAKVLNPMLLIMLTVIFAASIFNPMSELSEVTTSVGYYSDYPFFVGLLDGYNTCDALGSMVCGLVIIETIKSYGVTDNKDISRNILKICGVASALLIVVYALCTYVGTTSLPFNGILENGNQILQFTAYHYFGKYGFFIVAIITCLACLKTCVGLLNCSIKGLLEMYPNGLSYNKLVIICVIISFLIANININNIVTLSSPILNLFYPVMIILILLTLFGKKFNYSSTVYFWVYIFIAIPTILFSLYLCPQSFIDALKLGPLLDFAEKYIPLFNYSFGWLLPAIIGFIIGLIRTKIKKSD